MVVATLWHNRRVSDEVTELKLPLVILSGSDSEPAQLPESGAGKHPLRGPKGMAIHLGGRPLIDELIDRLREIGAFQPIFVAGPRSSYGDSREGAEVIDTDGSFGENIRAATEAVQKQCPDRPVAFTVCDILPDLNETRALLADYAAHQPLDFWFPMILAPDREHLGASAWKPQYRVAARPGEPARAILPGHLIIVDPSAMRLGFIFRSFDLAYRTRNRSMAYRFFYIVGHLLLYLLNKDFRQIAKLRVPGVTLTAIYHAAVITLKLGRRTMASEELAERFRMIFVRSAHRRENPDLSGRLPIMDAVSFAKDMDTQEEAEELAEEFGVVEVEGQG